MDAYEGWAVDPFEVHEVRYFVDGRPTKLVRDGSVESFDDLPPKSTWPSTPPQAEAPGPPQMSEPETEPGLGLGPEQTLAPEPAPGAAPPPAPAGTSYWVPPPPPSPSSSAVPPPPPPPPPLGGVPGERSHKSDLFGSRSTAVGESSDLGLGLHDNFAMGSSPQPGPRGKRRVVTVLVALVAAVTATGLVLVAGGGKSAEAAVIESVNSTMADGTAHVSVNLAVKAPNATVTGTGTGVIDFGQSAMQLQMTLGLPGQQIQMQALYIAGSIYEQIPGIATLIPGKSWISLDLSSVAGSSGQSSSALGTGDNPTAMLRVLAQHGNRVVPLGSSTINGTTVHGYVVTLDPTALRARLAQANLPTWMSTALSHVNIQNTTAKVYIDDTGLLRRFAMYMTQTVAAQTVSVDESVDFSGYGTPVNVSAPPPDQVATFSQFLQKAQSAG
jgi:hypothetical protein